MTTSPSWIRGRETSFRVRPMISSDWGSMFTHLDFDRLLNMRRPEFHGKVKPRKIPGVYLFGLSSMARRENTPASVRRYHMMKSHTVSLDAAIPFGKEPDSLMTIACLWQPEIEDTIAWPEHYRCHFYRALRMVHDTMKRCPWCCY